MLRIKRCPNNPIVRPGLFSWRRAAVFNPAAVEHNGLVYLLERAAGGMRPNICRFGLLSSEDGVKFKHVIDEPVFSPSDIGWPEGSVQDPRIVKLDGLFYMTFAARRFAVHVGQPRGFRIEDYYPELRDNPENFTRSAIAVSEDLVNWKTIGFCTPPDMDDRDVILFPERIGGRFALLRRPQAGAWQGTKPAIYLCYSDDLIRWTAPVPVAEPEFSWESSKIGGSTPPIRTEAGWLLLYHGVDAASIYRLGALLLDLKDPSRVLARTRVPIMEPQEDYEKVITPLTGNVVFPCGAITRDGLLHIYYGCCDYCVGLATAPFEEFVNFMLDCGGGDFPLPERHG